MTITEKQTTADTTRTVDCADTEVRAVLAAIRQNGGFILSSGPTSTGYRVTYTVYR